MAGALPAGDARARLLDLFKKDEADLLARLSECRRAISEVEGERAGRPYEPPPGLWMTFDDVFAERGGVGARFKLGLPLLDAKLDGGLYAGTLTAIQGAPGLGKTALATQLALHLSDAGCSVGCYFGDEGNSGAFVTFCQQLGIPRAAALANDPGGVQPALEQMRGRRHFSFIRPSHRAATLESMVEGLVNLAPNGPPRVLLIDSAQVLRLSSDRPRESPVERIHRSIHELRDLTLAHQLITLLVSRVHRGAYGKKKQEDEVDPIAAAWGGVIEWLAELILHLDGKPTREDPKVALVVAKNRVSVSGTFTLPMALDWPRKRFVEIEPEVVKSAIEIQRQLAFEDAKKRIVAVLKGRTGISGAMLEKEVGGNRQVIREARLALQGEGALHSVKKTGKGGGELWKLGPPPEDRPDPEQPEIPLSGGEKEAEE